MAGTTIERTQAGSGTEDCAAVRFVLEIDTALGMAALGRDTVGISGARQGIPCGRRYWGEGLGHIGSSRIGGATGKEDKAPDQAHHQEEQDGVLHE